MTALDAARRSQAGKPDARPLPKFVSRTDADPTRYYWHVRLDGVNARGHTLFDRFQGGEEVLEEVQLLVAGGHGEVVAVGGGVRPLRAERRVGEDHVELAGRRRIDGVGQVDARFDAVEEPKYVLRPTRLARSRSMAPPFVRSTNHS